MSNQIREFRGERVNLGNMKHLQSNASIDDICCNYVTPFKLKRDDAALDKCWIGVTRKSVLNRNWFVFGEDSSSS